MNTKSLMLLSLFAFSAMPLMAATKSRPFNLRQPVYEDGIKRYEPRHTSFPFRVEVISDDGSLKMEDLRSGRAFITAEKGERYAIRLYNPLPVRAAVNLTVDGLNSLNGKPCGIEDGAKWMIDPYSYVTIPGWQVSGNTSRRFFFTEKPKSYAKWRSADFNKDLSANCGVIGAAFFWNKDELRNYYEAHPVIINNRPTSFYEKKSCLRRDSMGMGAEMGDVSNASAPSAKEEPQKAGTGMGEKESHPIEYVDFHYNEGMYRLSEAVLIYYDFATPPVPQPFPGLSYAPEMPY